MLADLGAEIVKVEPPDGDTTRFATPKINGVTAYYAQQNSGKRNVSLNMNQPEAKEIILALAERSDVLIENFRPGVASRMGIGYDTVLGANPAHRLRVDQRLRPDRAVRRGAEGRLRLGGRPPRLGYGSEAYQGRRTAAGRRPTTRSATPTCTPGCRAAPGSWRPCTSTSGPGRASTSTCPWVR